MSFEWKRYSLSELVSFKYGKFLAKSKLSTTGYPVFSGYGIVGYLPHYQFENPELIMVCRGEGGTGDVKMSPPQCSITNLSIIISPDEKKVSRKFLYWALKANNTRLLRTGSAQSQIVISSLENYKISIPIDKAIQASIAGFLDRLEARITLLRETNKTLESIAQTIFKSWFVDFDPVRAKMDGRQPEGMDEETAALFPDGLENGLPKGWRSGNLSELSSLNPQSWTAKRHPASIEYIDLSNVKSNQIIAVMEIQYDNAPSRARRILSPGDTIIGTVRPGNRAFAYIFDASENLTGSTGFAVLRPLKKNNAEYIYLAATQDASIDYLAHIADGGAYPAVRPEVVASLPCVITDDPVKQLFHELAFPLFAKVSNNQRMIVYLEQLRDRVLPHLISGRLRISEEIGMAEAIEA